jgi:hypothetical protein
MGDDKREICKLCGMLKDVLLAGFMAKAHAYSYGIPPKKVAACKNDEDFEKLIESTPHCGNCAFGRKESNPSWQRKTVECHRYPPSQETNTNSVDPYPWPIMKVEEWCGEHKEKE